MNPGKSVLLSLRNVYETLAISVPTVVDSVRGTLSRDVCDRRLARWAAHVVDNSAMTITVHGRENVARLPANRPEGALVLERFLPSRSYLVMSNHQSHYDVAVIFHVLGSAIRMVGKRELFEFPVFGQAMRAAGFISVDRKNTKSAIASLANARASLEAGVPIWIAPEGTRSLTGELLPFKKGGFVLAVETGAPILPVTICGTRDALPAKGLRSRRGAHVVVSIHPPVDPGPFAGRGAAKAARDSLTDAVRQAIASAL